VNPNLTPSAASSKTAADIEAAALRWAVRTDRGPLSDQDRAALEAWTTADVRHAGAYARAVAANAYFDRAQALNPGVLPVRRTPKSLSRRSLLAASGGLLAASVTGAVGLGFWSQRGRIETPKGDVRRISLTEGSAVTLNTASAVRTDIGPQVRRISLLEGEALFDVVKDPARPFIVQAGDIEIRAIGTSFTVRRHADGQVEVAVREGVVEVRRRSNPAVLRLSAGSVVMAPLTGEISGSSKPLEELERAMAWRQGRLDLTGLTLAQAAAEFERYADLSIRIADPQVGALKVTGLYSISDPEGFARAAALSLGLEVATSPGSVSLRRPEAD